MDRGRGQNEAEGARGQGRTCSLFMRAVMGTGLISRSDDVPDAMTGSLTNYLLPSPHFPIPTGYSLRPISDSPQPLPHLFRNVTPGMLRRSLTSER